MTGMFETHMLTAYTLNAYILSACIATYSQHAHNVFTTSLQHLQGDPVTPCAKKDTCLSLPKIADEKVR
jgi:hypothetical protein